MEGPLFLFFLGRSPAVLWSCETSSNILGSFFSCSLDPLSRFDGSGNLRMPVFGSGWVLCQERESRWNGIKDDE